MADRSSWIHDPDIGGAIRAVLARSRRSPFDDHLAPALAPAPASLDAGQVLSAVESMDESQRARLAELLGIARPHPLFYLPRPRVRLDTTVPPGVAIWVDPEGREAGRIYFDRPEAAREIAP